MDISNESVPGRKTDIPYLWDSSLRCVSVKQLLGICILFCFSVCLIVYQFTEQHGKYAVQAIKRIDDKIHAIQKHQIQSQKNLGLTDNLRLTDLVSEINERYKNGSTLESIDKLLANTKDRALLKYLVKFYEKSSMQNTVGVNIRTKFINIFRKSKITKADCNSLFKGDNQELAKRLSSPSFPYTHKPNAFESKFLNSCTKFVEEMKYITSPLTKEEEMFPIAYSLTVYKDAVQVERLLRSIYRPQNLYCIHVDTKSKFSFKSAMNFISSCFENVFISSRSVDVRWGDFSNLETNIICMKDLLKYKQWKYYLNLSGQEFPLRTNKEIVDILTVLNGANIVRKVNSSLYSFRWKNAGNPPHGIQVVKGSMYVAVNRQFVEYIVYNKTAKDFLEWTKRTKIPDEIFFNSLNYNPQLNIPGSYTGSLSTEIPILGRFVKWASSGLSCYGQWIRDVCIFGVGDLPSLARSPALFTNKFYHDFQPVALDCMEELIYNRTRDECLTGETLINITYYKNLKFIKQIIK